MSSAAVPIYSKDIDETVECILDKQDILRKGKCHVIDDGEADEDHLDEDTPVPAQSWVVLSFIESGITTEQTAETFDFVHFVMNMSGDEILEMLGKKVSDEFIERQKKLLNDSSPSYDSIDENSTDPDDVRQKLWGEEMKLGKELRVDSVIPENENKLFEEGMRNCIRQYSKFKKEKKVYLEKRWLKYNRGEVRMDRGIKIRGSYKTKNKALARVEDLKVIDGRFPTYIGEVGKWLPFNPNPLQAKEYASSDKILNNLVGEYKKEQERSRKAFNLRKDLLIRQGQHIAQSKKREIEDRKEAGEEFADAEEVPESIKPLSTRIITEEEYIKLASSDTNLDLIPGGGEIKNFNL